MSKQEPLTLASIHKQVIPACGKCKSENVLTEAWARYNHRADRWDVAILGKNCVCDECGQDTQIKWSIEK
jgi:hypothetical protein